MSIMADSPIIIITAKFEINLLCGFFTNRCKLIYWLTKHQVTVAIKGSVTKDSIMAQKVI